MAFATFTAAHLDEHVVGEKWPVKMSSTTNSNIFVNTKPPSPAYAVLVVPVKLMIHTPFMCFCLLLLLTQ
jgi:hypothetical protein